MPEDEREYPDASPEAHARLAEALRTRGIHAPKAEDVGLSEQFFDTKIAPGLIEKGINADRIARLRAQFLADVVTARGEVLRARPVRRFNLKSGGVTTDAEMEALVDAAADAAVAEELADRYWSQNILPGLFGDVPTDALASMRENYIVDVMASPEAREQLRTIYG